MGDARARTASSKRSRQRLAGRRCVGSTESIGFTLVEEEPHHSFGVDLVGQVYELDLRTLPGSQVVGGVAEQAIH